MTGPSRSCQTCPPGPLPNVPAKTARAKRVRPDGPKPLLPSVPARTAPSRSCRMCRPNPKAPEPNASTQTRTGPSRTCPPSQNVPGPAQAERFHPDGPKSLLPNVPAEPNVSTRTAPAGRFWPARSARAAWPVDASGSGALGLGRHIRQEGLGHGPTGAASKVVGPAGITGPQAGPDGMWDESDSLGRPCRHVERGRQLGPALPASGTRATAWAAPARRVLADTFGKRGLDPSGRTRLADCGPVTPVGPVTLLAAPVGP